MLRTPNNHPPRLGQVVAVCALAVLLGSCRKSPTVGSSSNPDGCEATAYLVIDEVEPFSTDVTVWARKDGRNEACTERFWESDAGLVIDRGSEPRIDCAFEEAWTQDPPANRMPDAFVEQVRSIFAPLGYDVLAVGTPLSEGRQISAREVVVHPGGRADVRKVLVNGSRDLATVAGSPSNYSLSTRRGVEVSVVADALEGATVLDTQSCGLADRPRGSSARLALAERVLELARGASAPR